MTFSSTRSRAHTVTLAQRRFTASGIFRASNPKLDNPAPAVMMCDPRSCDRNRVPLESVAQSELSPNGLSFPYASHYIGSVWIALSLSYARPTSKNCEKMYSMLSDVLSTLFTRM